MFFPCLTQETALLRSSDLKILNENCPSHSHSTPAPISSMPSHYSLLCATERAISIHFQSISLLTFLYIQTKCSLAFSKSISGLFLHLYISAKGWKVLIKLFFLPGGKLSIKQWAQCRVWFVRFLWQTVNTHTLLLDQMRRKYWHQVYHKSNN